MDVATIKTACGKCHADLDIEFELGNASCEIMRIFENRERALISVIARLMQTSHGGRVNAYDVLMAAGVFLEIRSPNELENLADKIRGVLL